MKRNILFPWLVVGFLAFAQSAALAESPSEELERLRTEIIGIEGRLSDTSAVSQQSMLRKSLRDKVQRMQEVQQQMRSAAAPVPSPSPVQAPSPSNAPETVPPPRAILTVPKPAPRPSAEVSPPSPQVAARVSRPPSSSTAPSRAVSSPPLPEVNLPGTAPLTIYTAQELAIGPGTLANLDEVARLLRLKEFDDARREWNSYVNGERDLFEAQLSRLKALIHFVVRRAYVESDADLSMAAMQVDTAREKNDAAGIAVAQDAFTVRLRGKAEVAEQIRRARVLLQDEADRTLRPTR
ncbi:MAG: hypothetical protein ACOYMV_01245 [Verrucomicrobiia bacterium]